MQNLAWVFALFLCAIATLVFGRYVAEREDRSFVATTLGAAWAVLFPLLALANDWMPFSGGGDDFGYFETASTHTASMFDLLDFSRFQESHEQPGYPWLLSAVASITGPDLLALKTLNLSFMLANACVWYKTGTLLESNSLGRTLLVTSILLTPLWYYVAFLLKDISIVLLQGVFLLGLVSELKRRRWQNWVLIIGASFGLLLFRTALAAQNVVVFSGAIGLRWLTNENSKRRLSEMTMPVLASLLVLSVAAAPQRLAELGVTNKARVVGSDEMIASAISRGGSIQGTKALLFPVIYMVSETAGLNPQSWIQRDASWLHGALAVPWIMYWVPMYCLGFFILYRQLEPGRKRTSRWQTRLVSTPWIAIVLFIVSYFGIAFQTGDTTRWRLPDMPALGAVAAAGFHYSTAKQRWLVATLWGGSIAVLYSLFLLLQNN